MSHFSFSRGLYDQCALNKKDEESTAPFLYMTDSNVSESTSSCFLGASPFQHNQLRSISANFVDTESDLRGQTRIWSKCPENKYNPDKAKPVEFNLKQCSDESLVPEYTRINKPCNIFAGITINRFHPLCEDLQELKKIHDNNIIGVNTRLQVKDAYKKNL